jgi:hypothetical protein
MPDLFSGVQQIRVAIGAPNTWVALTIPLGAADALIQLDDSTATWRMSSTNTLNPATEGNFVSAGGGITYKGTATADTLIYISASAATTIQCLYVIDHP